MTDPVLLFVDALAIFRLSRLVTADSILDRPRAWLLRRWPGADTEFYDSEVEGSEVRGRPVIILEGTRPRLWVVVDPHWFGSLISCVWCISAHVSILVVLARVHAGGVWQWVALAAAFSAVAGILHSLTR